MGIFDRLMGREPVVTHLYNLDKPRPKGGDVADGINIEAPNRVRSSVRRWQSALQSAEDPRFPDRSILLDIYNEIVLDPHVYAVTQTMFNRVIQTPFYIYDGDTIDHEKTRLFRTRWFHDYVKLALEAHLWGFTAIQFGPVVNDRFEYVKSVDRYNVRVEDKGIVKDPFDNSGGVDYDLTKSPVSEWVALVDSGSLGALNVVAKWFIIKRESATFWAVYNELFGVPFRMMKTDISNKKRFANAKAMMENMGMAGYGIFHPDDVIELLNAPMGSASGHKTHADILEWLDRQISKALFGQTMIFEDGSSRSQAEVHERQAEGFVEANRTYMNFLINDDLIPRMRTHGFPFKDSNWFGFDSQPRLTKTQWADVFTKVKASGWRVTEAEINERLGVQVEEDALDLGEAVNKSVALHVNNVSNKE